MLLFSLVCVLCCWALLFSLFDSPFSLFLFVFLVVDVVCFVFVLWIVSLLVVFCLLLLSSSLLLSLSMFSMFCACLVVVCWFSFENCLFRALEFGFRGQDPHKRLRLEMSTKNPGGSAHGMLWEPRYEAFVCACVFMLLLF